MTWFPNINFSSASSVNGAGVGKAADKGSVGSSSSLFSGGQVDSFQSSNPLGVQPSAAPSTSSVVNNVSKLDLASARSQLSPAVQDGLALFGTAAPGKKSTPENTDVRGIIGDVAKLSLEEASGKLSPATLYGLQALGSLSS